MTTRSNPLAAPVRNARRVLIVDDDSAFADTIGAVINDAGFEVRVGYSASEALEMLDMFVPDVAIVDIHMSIVDGHALLAIFRAEPKLRGCTFVAISGYTSDEEKLAAFDHFFRKPFDMNALLSVLATTHH